MSFVPAALRSILRRVPGSCAICAGWTEGRFCTACTGAFAAPVARCPRCAERVPVAAAACGRCLQNPLPLDRALAAVDYAYPWDGLVARFKFGGADDLAAPLAALLQATVEAADAPPVDWIVPVPLAPERQRERGFNQAWELARRLVHGHARHEARALERRFDTGHQTRLALAARAANLRGAFRARPAVRDRLRGSAVALVDDVMTSGATLAEATLALREAGVRQVQAWVLARTPRD